MRVGLVVNPVAGIGGPAGLAGSDGEAAQRRARELGAVPKSAARAAAAVRALLARRPDTVIVTVPGAMGEDPALAAGASPMVLTTAAGSGSPGGDGSAGGFPAGGGALGAVGVLGPVGVLDGGRSWGEGGGRGRGTTAADTRAAVRALGDRVDLLLFAGGDGTARDVLDAAPTVPVLGVPAGVKVHSGCFAVGPAAAGLAAAGFTGETAEAEVVDLDEDAYRAGHVSPRLYGTLPVPAVRVRLSGRKTGSSAAPPGTAESIARELVDRMRRGVLYILGPGTTTLAVGRALGLGTSLLGVDVVTDGELVAAGVSERELLDLVQAHGRGGVRAVVSVVGGQGFLLGRGNQQISPAVLARIDALHVLAGREKLAALNGRPLLADTGDPAADARLSGHHEVITGHRESALYRVAPAHQEPEGIAI